jgi:hypothetical protein
LIGQLREAQSAALTLRGQLGGEVTQAAGIFVTFDSFPGVDLALQSLDPVGGEQHPELVTVRSVVEDDGVHEQATVFIPDGTLGYFMKRLRAYARTANAERPDNRNLVDRISAIGVTALEQLWTDPATDFPERGKDVWWELWLRRRDGKERAHVARFAETIGATVGTPSLGFPDRTVMLLRTTAERLTAALTVLDDLAELRKPRELASLLALELPAEQAEWVQDLADRVLPAADGAPAVTVLDTGVYREHPLLQRSLAPNDCHACDPTWTVGDHAGHGTEMAGLALFGRLDDAILGRSSVRLTHRLESVKIVPPPPGKNPDQLYGAVTATAVSLVEIEAAKRRRIFSLATTADGLPSSSEDGGRAGEPTSWSAAIDALSAGLAVDVDSAGLSYLDETKVVFPRLFVVSAGNIDAPEEDHLTRSDLEPIEDPAQAWNALTVGAYTDLTDASSAPGFDGWTALAPEGELSPFSRTGVLAGRRWPHKPDVVLEGGNVARSPAGTELDTPGTLQLLTTRWPNYGPRLLTVTNATSAATAQAAALCASVLADNPTLWPEMVRALVVHSAEWTPAMQAHFEFARTRLDKVSLLRRYGMGVPDLRRATRSATDALTLVVERTIHPYDGSGHTREMHLHKLPWPTDVLRVLGSQEVQLRVTLSYFIEPNPARRGWARRYRYASHGLRFAVRLATESTNEFRKRINRAALEEEENAPVGATDAREWYFGPDQRTSGSLHTDIWTGTAADLADRGVLAVYPVGGWWKENKARDHSDRGVRYALVVTIATPNQDVDIWTPVAQEVGVQTDVEI